MHPGRLLVGLVFLAQVAPPALRAAPPDEPAAAPEHPLLGVLADELDYALANLVTEEGVRPYYLAYAVTQSHTASLSATLGGLTYNNESRARLLDVDVRVGDYSLDSTHKIRGGYGGGGFLGTSPLSLEDDADAIRHTLWWATDRQFKDAVKRHARVLTNVKVKVEEDDKSDDFSREEPAVYAETPQELAVDRDAWAERLRKLSAIARRYPLVYESQVSLAAEAETKFTATSEGTRLQTAGKRFRLYVSASTKADDGMDLSKSHIFDAATQGGLPDDEHIARTFEQVIEQVLAIRQAPLVEPYTGPAILRNRASGVFFHEIFGHRIEGHRQKDVEEGQTFTKKVGQPVLPDFITVRDDPTLARLGDVDLRGHYRYDDEGVAAEDVTLVENGILKTFLLSRSPVESFPRSNGHGRRQPGYRAVARQGNLMVQSSTKVGFDRLRELLVEECRKQDKPYGLLFEDITGGFTGTRRRGAQTFKVLPVVVYRVYADGRPDELVRGVDIVGTPLSCFEKILATADDPAVFNGNCGAESGSVPVSAISPSILVESIEIEKRQRSQSRLPILPPPVAEVQ